MHAPAILQPSFRAGTFSNLQSADRAVARLLAAGFPKEQITVLCTDEVKESHYRQLGYPPPTDSDAPSTGVAGASIGATVGGLAAIAVGAATGAVPLIIAGAAGVAGGSALGGFLGAVINGEGESAVVKSYDRELRSGRILVVAKDQSPQAESKLLLAEAILAESTTEPA
jgi:phage tail tape-measure protein